MMAPSASLTTQPAVQAESFKGIAAALNRQVQAQFVAKDADKNKKITPDEWGIKAPTDFVEFRELDDNKNGSISLDEMQPGFLDKAKAWIRLTSAAKFMFKQFDKNNDKKVTIDEAKEITLAGVEAKWNHFAKGKKTMDRGAFIDYYVELMLNGDRPLKPGATPPAPPAPSAPAK